MGLYSGARNFYTGIIDYAESFQPYLLLAFRLYWGWLFYQAGLGKVQNIDGVIGSFAKLAIPFSYYTAHFIAWVELLGGAFLAFGFLSRIASLFLSATMITALFLAHTEGLYSIFKDASVFLQEAPVTYLMATLVVFAFGPGKFSIDGFFKRFVFKGHA